MGIKKQPVVEAEEAQPDFDEPQDDPDYIPPSEREQAQPRDLTMEMIEAFEQPDPLVLADELAKSIGYDDVPFSVWEMAQAYQKARRL
jgi:hypothetical protein